MAMIKKSQMMTLILCHDRDFKHRVVNFMNNIAFQSEKISAESIDEAKAQLERTPALLNLVIDGSVFAADINTQFPNLVPLLKKPGLMAMLFLTDRQMSDFKFHKHGQTNLLVRTQPFLKPDFNEAFHSRGDPNAKVFDMPSSALVPNQATPKSEAEAAQQQGQKKSLTAFEASQHVRETVDHINALSQDRTQIPALLTIGQRFNGMMGAFSFLQSKVGMSELKRLAEVIDSVAKTYEAKQLKEISQPHFELLLEAAKCAYKILMQLRDDPTKLSEDLVTEEHKVSMDFNNDKDLIKRSSQSQSQVDDMLKEYDIK